MAAKSTSERAKELRALIERGERMQWRPIETAPKDGTWVDLWVEGALDPSYRIAGAEWRNGCWRKASTGPSITYEYGLSDDDIITHWMPEPDPPTQSDKQKGDK